MRNDLAGWLIGATILVVICIGCRAAQPVAWLPRCYAATGHTVGGDFLRTFDAMGGERSLGYPITDPLVQEGRLVQYFEYARLEDHPDAPGGAVVKLSLLGERLGRRTPPLDMRSVPPSSDAGSRYYPATGHTVSGDFLAYFDENGGLERFGFPIGEPIVAGGNLVQDFQRVRFVWSARVQDGGHVTMEPSGRAYFESQAMDRRLLDPTICPSETQAVVP